MRMSCFCSLVKGSSFSYKFAKEGSIFKKEQVARLRAPYGFPIRHPTALGHALESRSLASLETS